MRKKSSLNCAGAVHFEKIVNTEKCSRESLGRMERLRRTDSEENS